MQHLEENYQTLDEFEEQQIATAVQLDAYEADPRQQEGDLEDKKPRREQSDPAVPAHESQQEETGSTEQRTCENLEHVDPVGTKEEESNLFAIMEEEVSDIDEDDRLKKSM